MLQYVSASMPGGTEVEESETPPTTSLRMARELQRELDILAAKRDNTNRSDVIRRFCEYGVEHAEEILGKPDE